jgi:hypothetical protein
MYPFVSWIIRRTWKVPVQQKQQLGRASAHDFHDGGAHAQMHVEASAVAAIRMWESAMWFAVTQWERC